MKYLPLFVILISCCIATADIVYLSNGSEIEGSAVQNDGRVIVNLPNGETKSFSESEVLYIAKGPLREKTSPAQPAETDGKTPKPTGQTNKEKKTGPTDDEETAADDKEKDNGELGPVEIGADQRTNNKLSKCVQSPADMLYEYLRRKISSPGQGLEDLISTARVRIHDRMYKIGPDWVKPEDFERRRDSFDVKMAEVQGLFKDAAKLSDKDKKEAEQKQTLTKNAQTKLSQAAGTWLDPLTRWFLIGVAAYNAQDYNKAIQNFHRCTSQAPWVAAFWQGLGDSMLAANRHEDAMYPYMMMLQMADDKSAAASILRDALAKTPGTKITAKPVMDAKKMLERYATSSKSSRSSSSSQKQAWLFPGKSISNRPDSLPQLPFDKFNFKQGVAIPIAPQALLVGADVVKDADTVILRMRDWLYATAKVETLKNEPIAILRVQANIQFTPIKISTKSSLKRGQTLTVIATDISPAMSTAVRDAIITVKDIDISGNVYVTGGLLPGEGSSPVLDSSGELSGFMAGKLETDKDQFTDKLITIGPQSPIAKRLMRATKSSKGRSGGPQPGWNTIEGQTFVVFAVGTEKLEKK